MDVSIVIPSYKEAENLDILLPQLQQVLVSNNYEIIVVDTMTPLDDTELICKKYKVNYVPREGGNSYGDAIRTGFKKAVLDYVLVMDADGSHSPSDLPGLIKDAENFDLTIGSRYIAGGKTDNPKILIYMSLFVNICFRLTLALNVKDISNSLRLYRTSQVRKLDLECDNFDVVEEIIIKLAFQNKGFSIREVPVTFYKRNYGESKRALFRFALSYLSTIYRLMQIRKRAQL